MLNAGENFSVRDLKLMFGNSVPGQIFIEWKFASDHSERVHLVHRAIDWVSQEMGKTPKERQSTSEDSLTNEVVLALTAMNFEASHDTSVGGHCDIVIKGPDNFLWLGEAKIATSYQWILDGFQQLDTRYATGIAGQDAGGLIIYTFQGNTKDMMDRWKTELEGARSDVSTECCPLSPLAFRSTHVHNRSGLEFRVRHMPVSLFWNPAKKRLSPRSKKPSTG